MARACDFAYCQQAPVRYTLEVNLMVFSQCAARKRELWLWFISSCHCTSYKCRRLQQRQQIRALPLINIMRLPHSEMRSFLHLRLPHQHLVIVVSQQCVHWFHSKWAYIHLTSSRLMCALWKLISLIGNIVNKWQSLDIAAKSHSIIGCLERNGIHSGKICQQNCSREKKECMKFNANKSAIESCLRCWNIKNRHTTVCCFFFIRASSTNSIHIWRHWNWENVYTVEWKQQNVWWSFFLQFRECDTLQGFGIESRDHMILFRGLIRRNLFSTKSKLHVKRSDRLCISFLPTRSLDRLKSLSSNYNLIRFLHSAGNWIRIERSR